MRHVSVVLSLTVLLGAAASNAQARGFLSPSFGYNFGGDSGCVSATDCEDKNWNIGISGGALGRIVGVEAEWVYESEFLGSSPVEKTEVMTLMANFMLAPRISIVQVYGLAGIGVIHTSVDDLLGAERDENQIGWNVGGGLIVYVHPNIGLKGEIRHYDSFEVLDLLDLELDRNENKLNFGRGVFGVVFKF